MNALNIMNKQMFKMYGETFIKADFGFVSVGAVEMVCRVDFDESNEPYIPNENFVSTKSFTKLMDLYEQKFGEFDVQTLINQVRQFFVYELIIQEDLGYDIEFLRESGVPCQEDHTLYSANLRNKFTDEKMSIHEMIEDEWCPRQIPKESFILNRQMEDINNFVHNTINAKFNNAAIVYNKVYAMIRQERMPLTNMK